jgi:hypothetical protein
MKVAAFVFVFSSSVISDLFEELRGNEAGGMFDYRYFDNCFLLILTLFGVNFS